MLVRLREGRASSRVLAGTLRRSGDVNRDQRMSDALGRSVKDLEEHGYGVRSVVEALALHCRDVDVPASPFVLDLANVMHLATDVTGTVVDGSTSFGLLASLHPSAAVCGAPTETARAVIAEVEGLDRGRYAGPGRLGRRPRRRRVGHRAALRRGRRGRPRPAAAVRRVRRRRGQLAGRRAGRERGQAGADAVRPAAPRLTRALRCSGGRARTAARTGCLTAQERPELDLSGNRPAAAVEPLAPPRSS
jgi:hypothetical protein